MMSQISFHSGEQHPLEAKNLVELLVDVDKRLPDPLNERDYFSGYHQLATRFVANGHLIYALYKSKILAGCAVIYVDPKRYPHAYETYIGVNGDFERQGIARHLTEMEFDLCRQLGMHRIMTNCNIDNIAKRKLNIECGYTEVTSPEEIASYVELNPKWLGKAFYVRDL